MLEIIKIENGFSFFDQGLQEVRNFIYEGQYEILNPEMVHTYTDQGIILLNLSCTIDGNSFTDINDFINFLNI